MDLISILINELSHEKIDYDRLSCEEVIKLIRILAKLSGYVDNDLIDLILYAIESENKNIEIILPKTILENFLDDRDFSRQLNKEDFIKEKIRSTFKL
jgi:hypothetical protein